VDLNSIRIAEKCLEEGDREAMSATLSNAYARFEEQQPVVATHVAHVLRQCSDEAARGLGVYLAISVWLSFLQQMEDSIQQVSEIDFENAALFLSVDADVRRRSPNSGMDTDDVVAMHQPALAGFIRERLDETLRNYEKAIDIDEVDKVYQLVLLEILALSYAVKSPINPTQNLQDLS